MIKGGFWDETRGGTAAAEELCGFPLQWDRWYFALEGSEQGLAGGRDAWTDHDAGVPKSLAAGRTVFLSWKPPGGDNNADVARYEAELAAGEHTEELERHVAEVVTMLISGPGRLYFTYHHEPMLDNAAQRSNYMACWDRFKAAFEAAGIEPIYLPIIMATQTEQAADCWRDWFSGYGVDGYNWYGNVTGHGGADQWKRPSAVFAKAMAEADRLGVPVFQIETGCAEGPKANDKPDWIRELGQMATLEGWEAIGWFVSSTEQGNGDVFRPETTPASLDAFRYVWTPE